MANPQHIEWLLEGVDAWNARRERDDFVPDFEGADIRRAFETAEKLDDEERFDLREANLEGANLKKTTLWGADLRRADLYQADLQGADLGLALLHRADLRHANLSDASLIAADLWQADLRCTDFKIATLMAANFWKSDLNEADLRGAELKDADFIEANLGSAIVASEVATSHSSIPLLTSLRFALNLTQRQLDSMSGDRMTEIPDDLNYPEHWPEWEQPAPNPPALPDRTRRDIIAYDGGMLSAALSDPPERNELSEIYDDLREAADDLRDLGNLHNQAPLLARGIQRFTKRITTDFNDVDQTPFAVGVQALRLQFDWDKPTLEDCAPEKIGYIDALLLYGELITARLPEWKQFLEEEEPTAPIFEAQSETIHTILEEAADSLERDPEHFDPSLFARIRDYLDDGTLYAYLAGKDLLLQIAHKTFTLARDFLKDTISESRKMAIKGIATALLAQLGGGLARLAGILPKELSWLAAWLDYLPTIL